jgi:spermidine synthase
VVSVTVERLQTPRGELVLRRDGEHHEIVSNGMFLMDTRDGRSERELVRAAVRAPGARVLIGGLGVGFSLAQALADPRVAAVTVVEIEPAVLRWNREHLGTTAALDDPRVRVVVADLVAFLAAAADRYDAICLDVDNGPEWTVTVDNAALYGDPGLSAVDRRLAPGGTLAVWSAGAAPAFEARLRSRYGNVQVIEIPVPRGEPDVVYVATGPPSAVSGPGDRRDHRSTAPGERRRPPAERSRSSAS